MKMFICACASREIINKEKITRIASAAKSCGWDVAIIPDLCQIVEDGDENLKRMEAAVVVGCHPRAMKSLLSFRGIKAEMLLNARTDSLDEILLALNMTASEDEADMASFKAMLDGFEVHSGDDAWYPTLDKDVCVECGKCYDFCPFGVYEMVNDRVRVVHPHNCKNNCPACARNCPASAIIFPKYDRSPINGGVEMQETAVQLDTRTLYNQNLKQRLESRRMSILKK